MSQRNTGVTAQAVLAQACPVREVLDRVAGKWSVLIIVAAAHGPIRFTELERSVEGISRRMLSSRCATWSATDSSPAPSIRWCRRRWSTNSPR